MISYSRRSTSAFCYLQARADAVDRVVVAFIEDLCAAKIPFDVRENEAGSREELEKSERQRSFDPRRITARIDLEVLRTEVIVRTAEV